MRIGGVETYETSRLALAEAVEARRAFWDEALKRGWEPSPSTSRLTALAPGGDAYPLAFRLEGAGPGGWPEEVRRTAEWRRWKRARDAAFEVNGGLVAWLVSPKVRGWGDDAEEAWSEARIGLLRGIDLWDPDVTHPKTGRPIRPGTYLGKWILQGYGRARDRRNKDAEKLVSLTGKEEIRVSGIDAFDEGSLDALAKWGEDLPEGVLADLGLT